MKKQDTAERRPARVVRGVKTGHISHVQSPDLWIARASGKAASQESSSSPLAKPSPRPRRTTPDALPHLRELKAGRPDDTTPPGETLGASDTPCATSDPHHAALLEASPESMLASVAQRARPMEGPRTGFPSEVNTCRPRDMTLPDPPRLSGRWIRIPRAIRRAGSDPRQADHHQNGSP